MNKYTDIDPFMVSRADAEDREVVNKFIEDYKDLLNIDLYTFILTAYDYLTGWPIFSDKAFEYLKYLLKSANLQLLPYAINIGDTVEIINPVQRYDAYIDFFTENNIEEYKDKYIKTQKEYKGDNKNKLATVIFKAKHKNYNNDDDLNIVYALSLKENPDKIFLYNREGLIKV